jgi:adenine-specific DNA-methyltransferase
MPRKSSKKRISVEAYSHADKKRKNNPPVGLVSSQTDKLNGITKYEHDPHIDPFLSWAGKKEGNEVNVRNLSLHIHERIDSLRIVKSFLKEKELNQQPTLFDAFEKKLTLGKAFEFYHHTQDWTNRLIAGDSLLVMNSLLQKEGMAGELQMIYIDPPFGITYNSNFQPFVNRKDVKDRDEDLPSEPETIKAFRDTWELGIHSYLSYLRDRLARELLSESGSIFVQIGDENIHHVRELLDEVFGSQNFFSLVTFRTTSGLGSKGLTGIANYLLWYAKDKNKIKYRQLFSDKDYGEGTMFTYLELPNGTRRKLTKEEKENPQLIPTGARVFRLSDLVSSGLTPSCVFDYDFDGRTFKPGRNRSWKTNEEGMKKLEDSKRLMAPGATLQYITFFNDFPVSKITNVWTDTVGELSKIYAVQTSAEVIKRCILMTTDPSDIVFDPTCGSGTTAYVAEQWGRRWITCDTSRVAIALAKQRLMASYFDYYQLAHPTEGVGSGFVYRKVPHITIKSIANNELDKEEILYDQPAVDKSRVRVAGPFTVEAVPGLRVKPFDGGQQKITATGEDIARIGETANQAIWRDELKSAGIRAVGGSVINFSRVEPMAGTKYLHAEGEILDEKGKQKKSVISFGPLEQRQVEEAVNEARSLADKPDFVIFAAFHIDPEASKDIDEIKWPGVSILKAQMSVDLLTSDLRKKRSSNQSYWLIGQPDIELVKERGGTYKVRVNGFDYYNPVTGEIDSGDTSRIAMWMLDTDYDEQSILPVQVFFPMKDEKRDWTGLAKTLNGAVNEEVMDSFTGVESLPFKIGEHKKVAVKIIDDRGIESFVIKKL